MRFNYAHFMCCEAETFPPPLHPLSPSKEASLQIPGVPWVVLICLYFPLESARTLDQGES